MTFLRHKPIAISFCFTLNEICLSTTIPGGNKCRKRYFKHTFYSEKCIFQRSTCHIFDSFYLTKPDFSNINGFIFEKHPLIDLANQLGARRILDLKIVSPNPNLNKSYSLCNSRLLGVPRSTKPINMKTTIT